MMGETREWRCLCRKVCSFHCFPVKLKQLFQSTSQTSKQNLQLHMKTTVNSPPSFTRNTHACTHTPERSFCHPDLVYLPRVSYLPDITENVPKRAHNFFKKKVLLLSDTLSCISRFLQRCQDPAAGASWPLYKQLRAVLLRAACNPFYTSTDSHMTFGCRLAPCCANQAGSH